MNLHRLRPILLAFLCCLTIVSMNVPNVSADPSNGTGTGDEKPAYDADLSGYDYPYKVHEYRFDAQGLDLHMAYMDVRPEADANGRTVVLLHGKNYASAYWKRTIEALVDRGYRVVAPDQIGFGKSSKPVDFQYTFHALAHHTRNLLDEAGVDGASLVAHSMGGMVGTRFALMYPDFTEKLSLVNPIGLEDWKRKVPYRTVDEWFQKELEKTPAAVKSYMKQSYFDGKWKPAYDPLVEVQAGWIRGNEYRRIARVSALTYDMIFTQPVLYEFPDLSMPVLLIIGQRDRTALGTGMVSEEVAKTMGRYDRLDEKTADAIPDSTLVELEGVGHVPPFEVFDRYITSLAEFLEE